MAAEHFDRAADQIAQLTAHVDRFDVPAIIRGGTLGQRVPAQITHANTTAQLCQSRVRAAAQACRDRAMIIAEYEIELARYDREFAAYSLRHTRWKMRYNQWWRSGGQMLHPGSRPPPPAKPVPPPAWAEVRRP